MKFTITIDCSNDGSLSSWSQEKENMRPSDKEKLRELKRQVDNLVKGHNNSIVHRPAEETI